MKKIKACVTLCWSVLVLYHNVNNNLNLCSGGSFARRNLNKHTNNLF